MAAQGFTALVVAAPRFDYVKLMPLLLPLLCASTPFAIYAAALQPLTDCFAALQASKTCVALQVHLLCWHRAVLQAGATATVLCLTLLLCLMLLLLPCLCLVRMRLPRWCAWC